MYTLPTSVYPLLLIFIKIRMKVNLKNGVTSNKDREVVSN